MHVGERFTRKSCAGVSGVHERAVAVVVAEEKRAKVLARFARLCPAADNEFLPALDLQLEPVVSALAGLVRRVGSFRHDAFPFVTARLPKHGGAVIADITEPQRI